MPIIVAIVMLFVAICTKPDVDIQEGYFTVYDESPTSGTIYYHQTQSKKIPEDLSEYDGVIAYVNDCSKIGQEAWIKLTDPHIPIEYFNRWKRVMVFDCGGDAETINGFFKEGNIIAELGYYIAVDSGAYALGRGVEGSLSWEDPKQECVDQSPIKYILDPDATPTPKPTSTPTPKPTATTIYVTVPPLEGAAVKTPISIPTARPLPTALSRAEVMSRLAKDPIFPLWSLCLLGGGMAVLMVIAGLFYQDLAYRLWVFRIKRRNKL